MSVVKNNFSKKNSERYRHDREILKVVIKTRTGQSLTFLKTVKKMQPKLEGNQTAIMFIFKMIYNLRIRHYSTYLHKIVECFQFHCFEIFHLHCEVIKSLSG